MQTQAHAAQAALPPGGAAAKQGGDFWDVGDADFGGQQLPQDHEFSELVAIRSSGGGTKPWMYVLLVLIVAAIGGGAYSVFVLGINPIDKIDPLIAAVRDLIFHDGETPPLTLARPHRPPPKGQQAHVAAAAVPKGKMLKVVEGNPYWSLPNGLAGTKPAGSRPWRMEEEETLRAGLNHRFTYQRYKTVQDVRKGRHIGSDVILWDALQDRKLWTRMSAAIGLAELSVEVKTKSLEQALGKERSELLANYFERFVAHASAAELYIMRGAVRLLDERGRLVVLRAIHRSQDGLRELYLAAATLDPGTRVQAWARQALHERPMPPGQLNNLVAIVRGEASADDLLHSLHLKADTVAAPAAVESGDPDADADAPAAEAAKPAEDQDEGSTDLDGEGSSGVEFFEKTAKPAAVTNDVPDASTFDYKD